MFKIESKDEKGIPEECILIPDNRQMELVNGNEYLIAYVLESLVKGHKNASYHT